MKQQRLNRNPMKSRDGFFIGFFYVSLVGLAELAEFPDRLRQHWVMAVMLVRSAQGRTRITGSRR
jgi:hypothetical protein